MSTTGFVCMEQSECKSSFLDHNAIWRKTRRCSPQLCAALFGAAISNDLPLGKFSVTRVKSGLPITYPAEAGGAATVGTGLGPGVVSGWVYILRLCRCITRPFGGAAFPTTIGFDSTQVAGGTAPGKRSDYFRAQAACLEGRGYSVK